MNILIDPPSVDEQSELAIQQAYEILIQNKPTDRSELARRYAVTITELEKVIGYFKTLVVERGYWPEE